MKTCKKIHIPLANFSVHFLTFTRATKLESVHQKKYKGNPFKEEFMNALNQIILEGNVVRQPEKKEFGNVKVCTIPIAVNRRFKNSEGKNTDEVSYFDIATFGKMAESCEKWCPKGRGIRVVGRLKQNNWKDDNGKNHSKIEIIAEHIEFKPFFKKMENSKKSEEDEIKYANSISESKKEKLAMLAEAAAATQTEQENSEEITF